MKGELYSMTNEEIYNINKQMKSQGYTEKEIADIIGMSTYSLRHIIREVSYRIRVNKMIQAIELKEKGYGSSYIGGVMEINESSVRRLLEESNKLEYHREIETERIYRMLEEGYDYSSIACKLGCDENHVKWIVCDEETITPAILEIAEELSNYNLESRPCTLTQITDELYDYYCDSYNVTKELINYILVKNGYERNINNSVKHYVYSK